MQKLRRANRVCIPWQQWCHFKLWVDKGCVEQTDDCSLMFTLTVLDKHKKQICPWLALLWRNEISWLPWMLFLFFSFAGGAGGGWWMIQQISKRKIGIKSFLFFLLFYQKGCSRCYVSPNETKVIFMDNWSTKATEKKIEKLKVNFIDFNIPHLLP